MAKTYQTCDMCIQASPEIDLERKKSQDLGAMGIESTTFTTPV